MKEETDLKYYKACTEECVEIREDRDSLTVLCKLQDSDCEYEKVQLH